MKIGIGNDHVAVEYKKEIKKYIEEKYGYEVVNYGTDSTERFNYPVSGEAVANAVVNGEVDKGIVICGTGVGISLAANKVNGIRCVTCSEPYSALLSRQHNNTNMLAFGARVVGIELAKMIVDAWLSGEYEGGRHQVRIDMLKEIEEKLNTVQMYLENNYKDLTLQSYEDAKEVVERYEKSGLLKQKDMIQKKMAEFDAKLVHYGHTNVSEFLKERY